MKSVLSAPGDYVHFQSQVPLHKIPIGSKHWRYYDFGPKVVPPLICIPGTVGTADVHYKQIMALSMKGYRIISVDIPCVRNHLEWVKAFEKFLDALDVHHVHLYGTSLGGLLAQVFAQHRPRRVRSLVLSNSFLDTHGLTASIPWAPLFRWTPSFLLKRYVLMGIHDGPQEPFIADSVDFVVSQVETLSREDLAARLSLIMDTVSVGSLPLQDSYITIMDTKDHSTIPQQMKDQISERYPGARQAYLKSGGDFPFLSRADEVDLHLQLHLRRVGVESQPELLRSVLKHGGSDMGRSGETYTGKVFEEQLKPELLDSVLKHDGNDMAPSGETHVGKVFEQQLKDASDPEAVPLVDQKETDHVVQVEPGHDCGDKQMSEAPYEGNPLEIIDEFGNSKTNDIHNLTLARKSTPKPGR